MALTVGQLREQLRHLPGDVPVVMSKDGEGNGFSPLAEAERAFYEAESTWSGEVYGLDSDPEDRSGSEVPCVVLWPTN